MVHVSLDMVALDGCSIIIGSNYITCKGTRGSGWKLFNVCSRKVPNCVIHVNFKGIRGYTR